MRSRASVPMAENMWAYLATWLGGGAGDIFPYLQKYGEESRRGVQVRVARGYLKTKKSEMGHLLRGV
jgi:hypothetical protein